MSQRVVIVGGGVIGLCCAYHCLRAGHDVTVLDRNPPRRDGCSFGNAGMVVPSHFVPLAAPGMAGLALRWMWNPESPFHIRPRLDAGLVRWGFHFLDACTPARVAMASPLLRDLGLSSRAAFEELAALPGNGFGFEPKGLLMLCRDAHTLDEEAATAERARELGIPAEVLPPAGVAALEPGLAMDIAGAVYFPKDCHLSPHRFMACIEENLVAGGCRFLWETEVAGWEKEGDRMAALLTSRGAVEADEFVVCGGSWSPGIAKGLGLGLPMQAGKGYSLTLDNPVRSPSICAILAEARVAVTPMGGALRFGGTMEIAGMDETVNPARVRGILKAIPRYYPEFRAEDFDGIRPWVGLRPCSPDGLPYVGRTRRSRNVQIATGHAMMGLSLAPVTGRLVAGEISGERPPWDITLLSPDRYG